jgi:hypothetical protein
LYPIVIPKLLWIVWYMHESVWFCPPGMKLTFQQFVFLLFFFHQSPQRNWKFKYFLAVTYEDALNLCTQLDYSTVLSFNVLLRKGFTPTIHIIASLKEHLFDYCIALLLFFWKGFNQFMHCINQFIWWYHCTFSYWLMPWVCFVRIMLCCFIHL